MPKRILVVDDEVYFRSLLKDCLEGEGIEVVQAENGRQAREYIAIERFDAVISDIRMPKVNGIELLHWIRATFPDLPVILVTGFSEIMETREAAEIGVKWFLPKPFRREELLSALEEALPRSAGSARPTEDFDDQYCKISIDDFVSGSRIVYDVFVRISKSKYVKIAHGGQDISIDRIRSYKSKKITHLYLRKDDFRSYVGLNLEMVNRVRRANGIEQSKKVNLLKHTGELVLGQVYSKVVDADAFESAKTLVTSMLDVIGDDDDLIDLIGLLGSHSDYLYAHSVGVSFISVLLARAIGWRSPVTLFKVSYGGLIHDIGLKEIPREILDKRRSHRTVDETILFETHPNRGAQILSSIKGVPTEVIQIVQQHHENCLGTGYPLHLKRVKISPLARLISVADEFCDLTLRPAGEEGLTPAEALVEIESLHRERFDPEVFRALQLLFARNSAEG